jgi:hypothetical protein
VVPRACMAAERGSITLPTNRPHHRQTADALSIARQRVGARGGSFTSTAVGLCGPGEQKRWAEVLRTIDPRFARTPGRANRWRRVHGRRASSIASPTKSATPSPSNDRRTSCWPTASRGAGLVFVLPFWLWLYVVLANVDQFWFADNPPQGRCIDLLRLGGPVRRPDAAVVPHGPLPVYCPLATVAVCAGAASERAIVAQLVPAAEIH